MEIDRRAVLKELARACRAIYRRGWIPATSGNFSVRLDGDSIAITPSGVNKGVLTADHFLQIRLDGRAAGPGKASAETPLHLQIYQRDATVGAVMHTHSVNATVVSRGSTASVRIEGYELLKAFTGIETHEAAIDLPIFENTQDMQQLAIDIENHMRRGPPCVGYLIRGHGLYTWGRDVGEAFRHLEALEFLLDCHRLTHGTSRSDEG